jgi:hypothetical protein
MNETLLKACAILLGPQARAVGEPLLGRLDAATLKRAFRRLALSTHPDVALRRGGSPAAFDSSRFIQSLWAYEQLSAYLKTRGGEGFRPQPQGPGEGPVAGAAGAAPSGARRPAFFRGPLPQRRLRFSEFLYFSGLISWQSLIASIVWQRQGRPRFGEIARDFRAMTLEEVLYVLRCKSGLEPTGAAACRLQLLTPQEVTAVLRRQRSLQKPIGRFFLERERMSRQDLNHLAQQLFRRNAIFPPKP